MSVVVIPFVVAAVVLPPLMQAAAMVILHRANQSMNSPVLALLERYRVAQCGFAGTTIISLLAINGVLGRPVPLEPPGSTIVVALALLIIAAPAGAFALLYWTGRFGDPE